MRFRKEEFYFDGVVLDLNAGHQDYNGNFNLSEVLISKINGTGKYGYCTKRCNNVFKHEWPYVPRHNCFEFKRIDSK